MRTWSIALCTYNGERYLEEQLASLRAQSRAPDELVVCDDGSADRTPGILSDFAASAGFPVRVHVNDVRLGSTRNFEQAVTLCTGELIALCDQDDVWRPAKLERLEAVFAADPGAGLVFSNAVLIDSASVPLGETLWEAIRLRSSDSERLQNNRAYEVLARRPVVTGAAAAFRRNLLPLVTPFPAEWVHDRWIAMIIASLHRVAAVPETLLEYRLHEGQQVGVNTAPSGDALPVKWRRDARRLEAVVRHVESRTRDPRSHGTRGLAYYRSRIPHLRARADVRERIGPWRRMLAAELLSGRYHGHAHGFSSAAADLLRPALAEERR